MSQGVWIAASAVTTQTHRKRTKSVVGEIVQEMLIPTPRGVVATVNEQQRSWVGCAGMALVDHFEHVPPFDPLRHSHDLLSPYG